MATVFDVAKYITEQMGELSAMKLQKLMYYSQAWNLVWEEEPLFADDFEAWANGPVLPALYGRHRGMFKVDASMFEDGDSKNLSAEERENIDKVLGFYGDKTAQWLSDLTHQEDPWLKARGDLPIGASSNEIIKQAAIHEYYSSL
ncbi:Panacea domain-containing protein [Aeromonas hydrophila]|uniref:Panacea domain-containing protein n=1 Tax=Aeromonas TaxID=642 RepID=UPI00235F37DD|nr:type II toxin-antitoxin system antitoxin SocA domain-containing protein [Aeromonas hydrophila]